jgi:hypothetical protein
LPLSSLPFCLSSLSLISTRWEHQKKSSGGAKEYSGARNARWRKEFFSFGLLFAYFATYIYCVGGTCGCPNVVVCSPSVCGLGRTTPLLCCVCVVVIVVVRDDIYIYIYINTHHHHHHQTTPLSVFFFFSPARHTHKERERKKETYTLKRFLAQPIVVVVVVHYMHTYHKGTTKKTNKQTHTHTRTHMARARYMCFAVFVWFSLL